MKCKSCELEFCNWIPGSVCISENLEYLCEIGNYVLFILHVDIINIILHFCPPSDLGDFPVIELPVYCLTLSYIFKYILPSCDKEKTTEAKCMAPPVLIGILVFMEIPK